MPFLNLLLLMIADVEDVNALSEQVCIAVQGYGNFIVLSQGLIMSCFELDNSIAVDFDFSF